VPLLTPINPLVVCTVTPDWVAPVIVPEILYVGLLVTVNIPLLLVTVLAEQGIALETIQRY
jgi:hypothetical protein